VVRQPRTRRSALRWLGAGAAVALAGCVDFSDGDEPRQPTGVYHAQGRGSPVSIDRTRTDVAGYGDGFEYDASNETVRYVTARNGAGDRQFETVSFDRWGTNRCVEIGARHAAAVTADRLGVGAVDAATGLPHQSSSDDGLVVLLSVDLLTEDGTASETPSAAVDRYAAVAPRVVHATVTLERETVSTDVPVYAHYVGGGGG
jgi:hypothetical protein